CCLAFQKLPQRPCYQSLSLHYRKAFCGFSLLPNNYTKHLEQRRINLIDFFTITNLFLLRIYYTSNRSWTRSEEHTSELQSRFDLVCRLLLEKKKNKTKT